MSSYPCEFMGLNTSVSFIWTKSQVLCLCLDKEGPVTFYLSFPKAVTKYLRGEGGKPYCLMVLKVLVHRHLAPCFWFSAEAHYHGRGVWPRKVVHPVAARKRTWWARMCSGAGCPLAGHAPCHFLPSVSWFLKVPQPPESTLSWQWSL